MRKGITTIVAAVFYVLLLSNSTGSPVGSAGAPGEQTCGRSGCHGVDPNLGNAELLLDIENMPMTYEADQTYSLTVRLENTETIKNGFQIVALDAENNNAGLWTLTDTDATRERVNNATGRSYVTHTFNGNQQASWEMDWTAPTEDVGEVTFYISALDTNNNSSPSGDDLYTTSSSLSFEMPNALSSVVTGGLEVYPNPASEVVVLNNLPQDVTAIRIYNLTGKVVRSLTTRQEHLNIQDLKAGLHFVQIQTTDRVFTQQFVVQK
ncbi:MAG: choice-of-anchor V domain-containing protein [Bacteroidota bacterium]